MGASASSKRTPGKSNPGDLLSSSYEDSAKSKLTLHYEIVKLPFQEEEEYRRAAQANINEAWRLLNDPSWKLVKQQGGDSVYSMIYGGKTGARLQKIFKIIARMDINAGLLKDDLWFNVDQIPDWDTALLESHRVVQLDDRTDITYQITATSTTGLVTSRDFVNLRSWQRIEEYYIIAHHATEYPTLPKGNKYIRAENGVSCFAMQIDPDDISRCLMHFVINTNLKGWIPQYLLDAAITEVLFKYVGNLRGHVEDIRGTLNDYQLKPRKNSITG